MLNAEIVLHALLIVLGLLWCRRIFKWRHRDLEEFKTTQSKTIKSIAILSWTSAVIIGLLIFRYILNHAINVFSALR